MNQTEIDESDYNEGIYYRCSQFFFISKIVVLLFGVTSRAP
jgi:hypothetical protein